MTTARSPLRALKAQSDKMAALLKAAERGEVPSAQDTSGTIATARTKESIKFGVIMDDKVLRIEMSWATIRSTSESGISEYILKQMRDSRDTAH